MMTVGYKSISQLIPHKSNRCARDRRRTPNQRCDWLRLYALNRLQSFPFYFFFECIQLLSPKCFTCRSQVVLRDNVTSKKPTSTVTDGLERKRNTICSIVLFGSYGLVIEVDAKYQARARILRHSRISRKYHQTRRRIGRNLSTGPMGKARRSGVLE